MRIRVDRSGSIVRRLMFVLAGLAILAAPGVAPASFVTFESGQVRPLALSPDGSRLFAVNTPDGRLEVFGVTSSGLTPLASVPVGVEPVAVAARSNTEVWVVNHLSDSVSIVDAGGTAPHVVRTLLVGDEPRDIVFANGRAFISTAHRGQQRTDPSLAGVPGAGDPQFTTAGVDRADVWVFDPSNLGTTLGGIPLQIVTLFGDTPRALAVSADGGTVYAAIFKSGNQSTALAEGAVCNGFTSASPCVVGGVAVPGGLPGPSTDSIGQPAPETGLIVKRDPVSGLWKDGLGRDWSAAVLFNLPDHDVFAIDAGSLLATPLASGVGTTLFNMVANPVSGTLYVSNTESGNEVRFEGPGIFGGSTVQGNLAKARITVVSGANVLPRHLNKHINYAVRPAPAGVKDHSLATPTGMAVSPDGTTLFVAAFGSSKIGVFDTADLESDAFDPVSGSSRYIPVSGGGPSGLVLDAARNRLYVLTRFDDAISVVDAGAGSELAHLPLHNPEPASVVAGRPFLYDAANTSSNGEASCSSCHIFGDMDDLAWDLGNPDDPVKRNPIPINLGIAVTTGFLTMPAPINGTGRVNDFHPMKGPMTTQTLRGMDGSGAMHWRGDRANPPGNAGSAFDEVNSFNNFNVAFPGLVGRDSQLPTADMQKFTDFALQITLPPNPNRALDNSLNASELAGRSFFLGPRRSDGLSFDIAGIQVGFTCNGCHELDATQNHFGTGGRASFENEEQIIKIPHLRNLYQKVGMFGVIDVPFESPLHTPHQGDQVRGFGFLHDGSVDTLFRFLSATVFRNDSFGGPSVGFENDQERRDVEQFLLAFDTNLAPIVGQQATARSGAGSDVGDRITLMLARAAVQECDVIVKGAVAGEQRGWYRRADGKFVSDRSLDPAVAESAVRALANVPGQELTYTCVPAGEGLRAGVDRDEDGFLDRDELDLGTDPSNAGSFPGSQAILITTSRLKLRDGSQRHVDFAARTPHRGTTNRVAVPAPGTIADPTAVGATLVVYNSAGLTTDAVTVPLPAAGWTRQGSTQTKSFTFRSNDPSSPVSRVVIGRDKLTVRGGGSAWDYTLDEASQGRVAVRLQLGNGQLWCADAPARTDQPGTFVAQPKSPAPAACPTVP